MAFKMQKNLLTERDVYSQYYGDFRGVDFSSDHTQVDSRRFAYLVNMYKDYQSGQGDSVETVPGFRPRFIVPGNKKIHAIHKFHKGETIVLIHAGKNLYKWDMADDTNVEKTLTFKLPSPSAGELLTSFSINIGEYDEILSAETQQGEDLSIDYSDGYLTIYSNAVKEGDIIYVRAVKRIQEDTLFTAMNERKSVSFVFNNLLYILDGKNYLYFDGEEIYNVGDSAYIPLTHTTDKGNDQVEQRNLLRPEFRQTFLADGEKTNFRLLFPYDEIVSVTVYGQTITDYTIDGDEIIFKSAPTAPEKNNEAQGYEGIEVVATKKITNVGGNYDEDGLFIQQCTIACVFDNRVFFAGNPKSPNVLYWSAVNDPSYFGEQNYVPDGVDASGITALMPVANTLLAIKSDTQSDGAVFFHTGVQTGINLVPIRYESTRGLNGIGCLGECVNFLDDPIFISRLGVEAVGQLSVRYERAIEHRSSLIDASLVNNRGFAEGNVSLLVWAGYLLVLVDGQIYLADSRQRYTHGDTNTMQYEWYYLDDIGIYDDQYLDYKFSGTIYSELDGVQVDWDGKTLPLEIATSVYSTDRLERVSLIGTSANQPDAAGKPSREVNRDFVNVGEVEYPFDYVIMYDENDNPHAYFVESQGNKTGGKFRAATCLQNIADNVFFGTENGYVCSFNFDMRYPNGDISASHYHYNGRTIRSGCATKMDCCGIPHLTKSTVKKSTVIKTKSMLSSVVKIKVRTNRKPYEQVTRINSNAFDFANLDFSDLSFETNPQSLFSVREKEKKWVEKQYFLYSDEFLKPFSIYYIAYRYKVAGRYKE